MDLLPSHNHPVRRPGRRAALLLTFTVGLGLNACGLSNIFVKLQVTDRAEAIVRARRAGLGE